MNIKGKIAAFSLILLLSAGSYGCGSTPAAKPDSSDRLSENADIGEMIEIGSNQVVIGFSLGTLKEERWISEKKYFEEEAAKYGAKVLTQDANMDEKLQKEQIESFIDQKVDVLVVVAVNDETASECVKSAKNAGIPVLAYSRMITSADLDAFIGFDAVGIGETLAQAAVGSVPSGNYFIINGSPIDSNAKSQQKGYYNILNPYIAKGDIKVSTEVWCDNWSPDTARTEVENALKTSGKTVDAIIVSNDGMAGGVIEALKEQNLDGKVFVSGTDGDLSALKRISKGEQTVTLLFPQKEFAEEAARAAISLANDLVPADATGKSSNGLKDVPTIFAKTVLVTKDNLDEKVIEPGIRSYDDIYGGTP